MCSTEIDCRIKFSCVIERNINNSSLKEFAIVWIFDPVKSCVEVNPLPFPAPYGNNLDDAIPEAEPCAVTSGSSIRSIGRSRSSKDRSTKNSDTSLIIEQSARF